MLALWPTPDDVGVAVTKASRALLVDPIEVQQGVQHNSGNTFAHGRARLYAATALRSLFGDKHTPGAPGNTHFSRMVGGHKNILSMFDRQSYPRWWYREIYDAVKAAIIEAREKTKPEPIVLTMRRKPVPVEKCSS